MDYVVDYCIQDKPEFAWWISKVLRGWNGIISKVKSNYWRMTHTFGICFLKTVEYALWFDKEAGNYYWERALNKEMIKVKVARKRVNRFTLKKQYWDRLCSLSYIRRSSVVLYFTYSWTSNYKQGSWMEATQ